MMTAVKLTTLMCSVSDTVKHEDAIHTTSARAEMTFPSVVRDLLIFAPSWDKPWVREHLEWECVTQAK